MQIEVPLFLIQNYGTTQHESKNLRYYPRNTLGWTVDETKETLKRLKACPVLCAEVQLTGSGRSDLREHPQFKASTEHAKEPEKVSETFQVAHLAMLPASRLDSDKVQDVEKFREPSLPLYPPQIPPT